MTHDVTLLHGGDESIEEMQIGAADSGSGYLDDGVVRIQKLWIVNRLCFYRALAHPTHCFHRELPSLLVVLSCPGDVPGGVFIFSP